MDPILDLQRLAPVVSLYSWESADARRIAAARLSANSGRGDRRSYDPGLIMDDNLSANVHSVVAEIGTARALGGYCYNAVWTRESHDQYASDLPDVLLGDLEVEVKWRRKGRYVPIDQKDADRNRIVVWTEASVMGCEREDCVHRPARDNSSDLARILGWTWAAEAWPRGKQFGTDPARRAVSPNVLKSVRDLVRQ